MRDRDGETREDGEGRAALPRWKRNLLVPAALLGGRGRSHSLHYMGGALAGLLAA